MRTGKRGRGRQTASGPLRTHALAHHGASTYAADMATWNPLRGSPDSDLLPDLDRLVARGRDLERNNGVAHGGLQTIVDNVVGVGLRLSARPNYRALGRDKDWADDWAQQVEARWWGWAETTACHTGDTLIFDQLTAQALRAQLSCGEAIGLPYWIPERGDGFATKLQLIEADRLSNPNYLADTEHRRGGIEFDAYGVPVGYWIRRTHPGDFWLAMDAGRRMEWEFIPRLTTFGRRRVIHVFDPERPSQSRGKPILAAVLPNFKSLDRYASAELQAAVVNAMIAGIIETPMDQESIIGLFQNDSTAYLNARKDHAVELKAGQLLPVFPGDKVQPFMPARPAAAFGTFVENVFRIIGVGLGLPYELLLKDFSKTNYSSARAALLEAWRSFNRRRDWLGTTWCDPVYALWLEEQIDGGYIDAPDFAQNRAAYLRCRWLGPGRGWVDPVKEAMGAKLRMEIGVSTLEDECGEQGKDWREVMEQRARELRLAEELGLPAPADAGSIAIATAAAPQDGTEPDEPAEPIPGVDQPVAAR